MRVPSLALALLALAAPACRPSRGDLQRGYAQMLRPAPVRAASGEARPVTRTLKVRAYADPAYRAHAADWEQRIAAQVEGASAVVERDFGVRLALEAIRPWDRAETPPELEDALDALAGHDRAREVDWVVGFVAPAPEDPGREHEYIGIAASFGRHFVLRAMQTAAEVARIGVWWDELTEEERAAMARERRMHREIAVFLHEWGHTVGAVHECDDKWIMTPTYSILNSTFSPESARLIRVGLEHRDLPAPERAERWASAWRAEAARMQGASWECAKLEEGLAKGERLLADAVRRSAAERFTTAVREAVAARMKVPEGAASTPESLRVELRIDGAGALRGAQLLAPTGVPGLDEDALQAVRAAQPFAPPPGHLLARSGEVVVVIVMRLR